MNRLRVEDTACCHCAKRHSDEKPSVPNTNTKTSVQSSSQLRSSSEQQTLPEQISRHIPASGLQPLPWAVGMTHSGEHRSPGSCPAGQQQPGLSTHPPPCSSQLRPSQPGDPGPWGTAPAPHTARDTQPGTACKCPRQTGWDFSNTRTPGKHPQAVTQGGAMLDAASGWWVLGV